MSIEVVIGHEMNVNSLLSFAGNQASFHVLFHQSIVGLSMEILQQIQDIRFEDVGGWKILQLHHEKSVQRFKKSHSTLDFGYQQKFTSIHAAISFFSETSQGA